MVSLPNAVQDAAPRKLCSAKQESGSPYHENSYATADRHRWNDCHLGLLFNADTGYLSRHCWYFERSRLARFCFATDLCIFRLDDGIRVMETQDDGIERDSTLTCPLCGHKETEEMPTDACQWFYDCRGCGAVLQPRTGDCCVFCSYGSAACPPVQLAESCSR